MKSAEPRKPLRKLTDPVQVEGQRLLNAFGEAVQELVKLHEQQFLAVVDGDDTANRFDILIHEANERKQRAKYAYLIYWEKYGGSLNK